MEPSSSSEIAALVAAWHNRHPLARRISAAQVKGAGLVALPFVAERGSGASDMRAPAAVPGAPAAPLPGWRGRLQGWLAPLRQRLPRRSGGPSAPPRPGGLRAAFNEDFIAPLRPARVARFARRHGTVTRPNSPLDWPQRDVARRPGRTDAAPCTLYLRTAAIEVGQQRRRVLIGAGPRAAVTGPRLWSRPRVVALLGLAGCAVTLAAWFGVGGFGRPSGETAGSLLAQSGSRSAASGAVQDAPASAPVLPASASATTPPRAAASSPTGAPPAAPTSAVAVDAHSTPADPATAVAHASMPVAASAASAPSHPASAPTAAVVHAPQDPPPAQASDEPRRSIRPTLSPEERLAARQESEALRAAHPASAAAAASASDGKVYAVATPATRTRAGAQLRIVLMNAPTEADPGRPRAELMQVGAGWRAVIWPFDNRDAAERTRDQLVSRGIPAEVIGF